VAFGVLSGLPAPTGDHLASLRGFIRGFLSGNLATWTAQPNPARRPGGGLIGNVRLSTSTPWLSPLPPSPHVTVRVEAPAPACPRTSRETLRRRKREDYRHGFGRAGMMMPLSHWRCWAGAMNCPRRNRRTALEGAPRHTPLRPAGHLPLKGGDRPEARSCLTRSLEIAVLHSLPTSCPCTNHRGTAEHASFDLPP